MESELDVLLPELVLGFFTAVEPFYEFLDTLDVLEFFWRWSSRRGQLSVLALKLWQKAAWVLAADDPYGLLAFVFWKMMAGCALYYRICLLFG